MITSPKTRQAVFGVDSPAPTVMAMGIGNVRHNGAYQIETGGAMPTAAPEQAKPAYRVPLMSEIASLEPNGYTVVSTFSGCGGSCLGFRMAGYRVLWASEFIPEAAATYRANHPETPLDTRDIREIGAESILATLGTRRGEVDVLEGSPPCASFSTAGKREAGWGKVKAYSDTKQRVDDLFFEYARLLDGLQPRVFVAENVSGLVKGTAKGYFKEILAALKACGYVVEARLLDAQWLGVPQARQRIIFVGVRSDLGIAPAFPKPLPYRYSVRDALPWIVAQGDNGGFGSGALRPATEPSPTIGAGPQTGNGRFPASLVEARSPRLVGGNGAAHDGKTAEYSLDQPCPSILAGGARYSGRTDQFWIEQEPENGWNAEDRRARRVDPAEPSPTILHHGRGWNQIAVEAPTERRKFSIAELRRICGFPDDFVLTGTYAQQWERLGRAVPPPMMRAVAMTVRDEILRRLPDGD